MVKLAQQNPQVTIYVRERNGQHPRIVANYRKCFFFIFSLIELERQGGNKEERDMIEGGGEVGNGLRKHSSF